MYLMLLAWMSSVAQAASCAISGNTGMSFGAYDVFSFTPLDTKATVTITCTDVAPTDTMTVSLPAGPLQLSSGVHRLSYAVYPSADRSGARFGDGTGGTQPWGPATPAPTNEIDLFGRITSRQDVPGGSYVDTILVTVDF